MRGNRTIGRKAVLAAAVSAAMAAMISGGASTVCAGSSIPTDHFDPLAYPSLGNVNLSNGVLNINTDTGQMTGALTLTGTYVGQGTGGPNVLMFDFSNFQLGAGVTVNITGSAPLAILSRTNMNIATAFNLDGGNGDGAGNGGIARGGAGTGGVGGTSGANGGYLGAGGGSGTQHDGGGGAFGGNGGAGDTSSVGGTAYGNLFLGLQGGSGGAGAASPDGAGGGGGAGGGAIELTAVGTLSVATISANGGLGGNTSYDGGAGSGGGIRLYANLIKQNGTLFAKGGNGTEFGGAGGGGRMQFNFGTVSASQIPNGFGVSTAGGVSGGLGGAQPGAAGVIVETVQSFTEDTTNLFGFGHTSNPSGDVTVNVGTLSLPVGGGANVSPYTWTSGGGVNLNGGSLVLGDNMTFATGSNFNWSSGTLGITSGKTLTFDGGTGTFGGFTGLPNNATLAIKNAGKLSAGGWFDVGSSATGGAIATLTVDGPNSNITVGSGNGGEWADFGNNVGDAATVSFSNSATGVYNSGVIMSENGGASMLNISTNAKLTVNEFFNVNNASVLNLSGGTLSTPGAMNVNDNAVVNLSGGTLQLNDATFSGNSKLNWTGGVLGDNSKITFDGGVGSVSGGRGLPNGATLAVINGGSFSANDFFDIGSSFDPANGPTGTLLVSGNGSRYSSGGNQSFWGALAGDAATITFADHSVGTLNASVALAPGGGAATLSIVGGASLNVIDNGVDFFAGHDTSNGTASITINGGTFNVSPSASLQKGTTITYAAGGLNFSKNVTMSNNANIKLTTGGDKLLRAGGLTMTGTSKIDLADNDMIVGSLTANSAVRAMIIGGRNAGSWNGNGINSSAAASALPKIKALGLMSGAEFHSAQGMSALFDGMAVANTDSLIKFTYVGDANFNGKVDGGDYSRIDNTFALEHLQGNIGGWINGDFDYNGKVDGSDYGMIDLAFALQSGALKVALEFLDEDDDTAPPDMSADPSLQMVEKHFGMFGASYAETFVTSAPEPTTGLLVATLGCGLLKRRRRACRV